MQGLIRFSLFGNFERFNTGNIELYLKLIGFFVNKGFKPSTTNELQLQPNGQTKVITMPNFFNESNVFVEIVTGRINFQKTINGECTVDRLKETFNDEIMALMEEFVNDMEIIANRVALNCDITEKKAVALPTASSYFDSAENNEMNVRNLIRKQVESEESNIIFSKNTLLKDNLITYSYDINSTAENQISRFTKENIKEMFNAYISIAEEIEKGI